MADQKTGSEHSQQQSPKTSTVLRASMLKAAKLSDVTEPTNEISFGNKSTNSFSLRPSPLQHQASLLKEPALVPGSTSNSFKLEPPKLFSPVPSNLFSSDLNTTRDESETKENSEDKNDQTSTRNGGSNDKSKFVFGEKFTDRMVAQENGPKKEEGNIFVFGSNLADKVVKSESQKDIPANNGDDDGGDEDDDGVEILTPERNEDSATMSLAESAALQQARDVKPELKEVEVVTGEESESNVFKFNAKLHVFDKLTQNWHERGRGLLRLNDMAAHENKVFHSRLVMRAQGSLRVILNIMLWSGMLIEKASLKSVKISAVDPEEGIKIYLITANPNDAEQIYNAIRHRTQRLKSSEARKEVVARKRQVDGDCNSASTSKKLRLDTTGDESNDSSSAPYPETEASNEGFTSSSPAVQSSSSSDA